MDIQELIDFKYEEIEGLKLNLSEDHHMNPEQEDELEELIAQAIKFGELCAKRDAKARAVPEGFVLVPKENISCFWQDNDEPENFCNSSNDWDCLGDGIEKDQIMIVNKHTQANISTEKFYGAWKLIETSYGTRWKFELFKSESEAKQAMIEAQEQSHE